MTLNEAKTVYTYDDCLDLLDICLTDNYNNKIIHKNSSKKNGPKT